MSSYSLESLKMAVVRIESVPMRTLAVVHSKNIMWSKAILRTIPVTNDNCKLDTWDKIGNMIVYRPWSSVDALEPIFGARSGSIIVDEAIDAFKKVLLPRFMDGNWTIHSGCPQDRALRAYVEGQHLRWVDDSSSWFEKYCGKDLIAGHPAVAIGLFAMVHFRSFDSVSDILDILHRLLKRGDVRLHEALAVYLTAFDLSMAIGPAYAPPRLHLDVCDIVWASRGWTPSFRWGTHWLSSTKSGAAHIIQRSWRVYKTKADAARTIQRAWRECMLSPEHPCGRGYLKRKQREWDRMAGKA